MITLPGSGGLTGGLGTSPSGFGLSQGTEWTVGFSIGYASNLKKAFGSRTVGALCRGVTGSEDAVDTAPSHFRGARARNTQNVGANLRSNRWCEVDF